jgi:sulfonate transport system substrate-binding protein
MTKQRGVSSDVVTTDAAANALPVSRRDFLQGTAAATGAIAAGALGIQPSFAADDFTQWGWAKPYRQVSPESVKWLKSQGWWPMKVAWNPLWSDGNVVLFVIQKYKLLQKRGIEATFPAFLAAGLMNEAFIPGRIQVAQAGSLGLLRLIDLKVPTAAVAAYPAQRQAFLVPPDSPLKHGMSDLKGQKVLKRPAICGVTIGSTNHLGLLIAAKVLGLKDGHDFVVKNMGPADILTMPKGIDVTGIWEPNVLLMTEFLKNARILELIDTYEFFNGYSYIKGEIEQHAPDVIQAYADAFVEARLIAKLKPDEVLGAFIDDPTQHGRSPTFIRRDAEVHVLNPKPTLNYPFLNAEGFFIDLEIYQAGVMTDAGILTRKYTADDFRAILRPQYLAAAYERCGWTVPNKPVFLPPDWKGKAGHPPYPPYGLMYMGKQKFPGPGDLAKPWKFNNVAYHP